MGEEMQAEELSSAGAETRGERQQNLPETANANEPPRVSLVPLRRLFLKIFLWFWLTHIAVLTIVVSFTYLRGVHELTRPNIFLTVAPTLAAQALHVYESEGPEGFRQFAQGNGSGKGNELYLLNGYGQDVLGRPISHDGLVVAHMVKNGQVLMLRERIAAYRFVAQDGRPYVLLVYLKSKFTLWRDAVSSRGVLFLLTLLLLVTLLCLWLGNHITAPMYAIQSAARRVTQGDLSTRAPDDVVQRRDELASLAVDFNFMVGRIESLVRSHKDLLAAVSHELRSPLARLNVSLALLEGNTGASGKQMLRRMERDIAVIDRLIGQLLTFSRLDAGIANARREEIDLGQLVEEVGADGNFEAEAISKRVELIIHDCARVQNGDTQALRSACENIVRNAVRFTRPGTAVEIELAEEYAAENSCAVIAVRDHGPGVPEAMLKSIFDPFVRVDGQDARAGGNGLGLAIAAGAVRLHGGSIHARNRMGGGLEVVVRLPVAGRNAG